MSSSSSAMLRSPDSVFSSPAMSACSDIIQKTLVQQNTAETTVASSKILLKILQNLLVVPSTTTTTSSGSDDPGKHRRLRLTNKTISKHIVNVKGPLDMLALIGFEKDGPDHIFLRNGSAPVDATKEEMNLLALGKDQTDTIQGCCLELQQVIEEMERGMNQVNAKKEDFTKKTTTESSTLLDKKPSSYSSSTLSEDEYKARLKKIAKMKAEKKKQKEIAMQIWKEDTVDRKEKEERKEAAKQRQLQQDDGANIAPLGVTIHKKDGEDDSTPARLPKPFAPTKQEEYGNQQLLVAAAAARAKQTAEKEQQNSKPKATIPRTPRPKSRLVPYDGDEETIQETEVAVPAPLDLVGANTTPNDSEISTAMDDFKSTLKTQVVDIESNLMDGGSGDTKPAASMPFVSVASTTQTSNSPIQNEEWQKFLSNTPRCAPSLGIRATSCYNVAEGVDSTGVAFNTSTKLSSKCLKRIMAELKNLENDLPDDPRASMWVRFDEESPQYLRVLIPGPLPGPTPYTGGVFAFDVYITPTYPQDPPKVTLLTTGGGSVRFGPNLYANGKVCLSLLGTWNGPKWSPKHSTLLQVLISIQGLIFGVEHPYFLEPGHGGWEGNVKEGKYQVTGHTLSGAIVKQEMGIPPEVVMYEDQIRVGTVEYAMVEALQISLDPARPANRWLAPFSNIIQAHFFQNQSEIVSEVVSWTSDGVLGRDRSKMSHGGMSKLPIDRLEDTLIPQLTSLLSKTTICHDYKVPPVATMPTLDTTESSSTPVCSSFAVAAKTETDDMEKKMPAKRSSVSSSTSKSLANGGSIANKRTKMQAAAQSGDFILAGQLQQELVRLEQLEASMKEAAEAGDFVRAGNLQQQLIALTVDDADNAFENEEDDVPAVLGGDISLDAVSDDDDDDDDDENEGFDAEASVSDEDSDEDDGFNPPFGGIHTSTPMIHGLGNSVFAPPGWMAKHSQIQQAHRWGGGNQLGSTASATPAPAEAKPAAKSPPIQDTQKKKTIPRNRLCRLRVRLPNDKSIVEDFDIEETLSDVYKILGPCVEIGVGMGSMYQQGGVPGPSPAVKGSFSQPVSSVGFTLLLTRPKREFSLEMHGAKTLESLNLAPSATLTVMKCKDRGMVYRGELESRLHDAQGDAMDVDGLTYEGLVELTERVGGAAPSEGSAFVSLSVEDLEANSEKFSAADYLASLEESEGEDARRCPVCLGDYDASDSLSSIRKLKKCHHHFHASCLETWLVNKSSCPLCKTSIRNDE